MPEHHQKVALTRFIAVSAVLSKLGTGISFSLALREVTKSPPLTADGRKIRCSERTLRRWISDYRREGFDGLIPIDRRMTSASRVLENDFISYIRREKTVDQRASIPELMRRAAEESVDIGTKSRVTVWRAAKRLNLPIFSAKSPENTSMRRFSYPYPMQMVLTDGVHFRAGSVRVKRVAMILLDDATRFALAGVVGFTETTELFLQLVWKGITRHGLFSNLYVDNGSAFSSDNATLIFARLKIPLIYGTVDYPEGRGKIERFHRTLRGQFLRGLEDAGDTTLEHLELRLNHHLEHVYNKSPHDSLDGMTPEQKFVDLRLKEIKEIDYKLLREQFFVSFKRKASQTNDVQIDGSFFEIPRGYAGRIVTVVKDILSGQYFFDHDQKRIQIYPADYTHNAVIRRERMDTELPPDDQALVDTASNKNFRKTYRPIVSPSGDFYEKEH
jgi:transposase InsO family protein